MDAYDIFKKLTKGLTFKHRVLGVKNNVQTPSGPKITKEELKIKEEQPSDDEESQNEVDQSDSNPDSDHSNSDLTDKEDSDLQLLKGVKVTEKKRKKKNKEKSEDLKKKLELEEHNRFRNEHGIKAVGRHIPAALENFPDLVTRYNVAQTLVDTATQCGYSEPTPVQRQVIPCMLEDRQTLACAPTGSGKTAAFLLPVIHALGAQAGGPRALVLCPTRELAQQIYQEGLRLTAGTDLRVSVLRAIKESKIKEREATIRKTDILISTPNRLCYLLHQDSVGITLEKIHWLIIDEADKMFEGATEQQSTFRQQLEVVMRASESKRRRVAMFSATHTPAVARWARRQLRGLVNVTVGQRNAATSLVEQELLYCGNESGKLLAFRQLVQKGLKPPVLVFVQSKERAKQLFKELIYDGISVDAIHADRTQAQRDNVVRSFRLGRVWVLICTELMGRGIDFRGVNLVINYDFPPSAISYVHSIASVMKRSGCAVPEYTLQLKRSAGRRRARGAKAPRRDDISTRPERPSKRKHDGDTKKDEEPKPIDAIQAAKHKKQRKIQDGASKPLNKKQRQIQDGASKPLNKKRRQIQDGASKPLNKKQRQIQDGASKPLNKKQNGIQKKTNNKVNKNNK